MATSGLDLSSLLPLLGGSTGNATGTAAAPGWQQLLLGGMFGAGELGNLLEQHKQSEWQNYVMNLLKNPQQIAQMATAASQPLSQSLIKSITNAVQGETASRGLGQSPGIFSTTLAQALAPYQQQNYNTALSSIMSSLGLPGQMFQKPQNMSPLLSMFLRSFGSKGTGTDNAGINLPFPSQNPAIPGLTPGTQWPGTPVASLPDFAGGGTDFSQGI